MFPGRAFTRSIRKSMVDFWGDYDPNLFRLMTHPMDAYAHRAMPTPAPQRGSPCKKGVTP